MGSPQADRTVWILAGSSTTKTLQRVNLTSGKVLRTVPVNGTATSVAESSGGTLAVGRDDPKGTIEFRNGSSGALLRTTKIGQPVKALVVQGTTSTFFALDGTVAATTVNAVSASGRPLGAAIGVPLDSVALAIAPDASQLYLMGTSNRVTDISLTHGSAQGAPASFFVGKGAVRIALSDDGDDLFVLKSVAGGCNIGVVTVSTEIQGQVLAAPADSVAVTNGPNRHQIYVLVSSSSAGNIQAIRIG